MMNVRIRFSLAKLKVFKPWALAKIFQICLHCYAEFLNPQWSIVTAPLRNGARTGSLSILGVATKEVCFWWSEVIVNVEPASDKLLYPSLVRPEHLQLRELRCHGSNGTDRILGLLPTSSKYPHKIKEHLL